MDYKLNELGDNNLVFEQMEPSFFLVGLISVFESRFQAIGDQIFEEMSWKQGFAINCIRLFNQPPTLKELSVAIGSSHQNVKQILNKLEAKGFIETIEDEKDKRKQRIVITKKAEAFCEAHDAPSQEAMEKLFDGIELKDIEVTIKTILQMESNLRRIK